MGNRLSKIYTRTGDDGPTGLGDGSRGTTDELNSIVGMVLAQALPEKVRMVLNEVQHHLFDLGGELCIPGHQAIQSSHVTWLENTLDHFNESLPPLKDFISPFSMQYLNRLSDLLFVIARVVARQEGGSEVLWQKDRPTIDLDT